jgi:predicted metal-dependent hydrolase
VTVATQPGVGLNRRVQFDLFQKQQLLRASDSIAVGQRNVPLAFIVNHRARRYILRVRPDGTARVTVPRRGSFRAAREFANRNILWIDQQLQRLAARPVADSVWTIGSAILFRGETVRIVAGRDPDSILFADQVVGIIGAPGDFRPDIERHLRSLAALELPPKLFQFARQHGLTVRRLTVRNQKSRWGSCSRRGAISLNWRLIQVPPFVSDYILLHELMHLRQMNHSRKFWREVENVCPGFREAERWLRTHASLLQ